MAFGVVTDPGRLIYRFLDTEGDGTGDIEMTGDYTNSPTEFLVKADVFPIWLAQLVITISDDRFSQMHADRYGGRPALTNPIDFIVRRPDGSEVAPIIRGVESSNIVDVASYIEKGFTMSVYNNGVLRTGVIRLAWHWEMAGSLLALPLGWEFGVRLADDFTALTRHKMIVHGFVGAKPGISRFTF